MDDQHITSHWGISPAVDLGMLAPKNDSKDPLLILQVASYDCRHTLQTLCHSRRHLSSHVGPVHLYIYEEEPELLARQLLLLSVMLDENLTARDRVETLLELHGNVFLRDKTAKYLDGRAKELEALLVSVIGGVAVKGEEEGGAGLGWLAEMLDVSGLKYQQRDELLEAMAKYKEKVVYNMVKAWDCRNRKFYADRYDFRRNMIDWDYHMRLAAAGTPGQPVEQGSIIHFVHFRQWRMSGVAYELRDSNYSCPNRTLLSTVYGRTKEFKDRNGKDVGRSVSAWGFWGDQLNGPYHSFGTICDEPSFFKWSNKQWVHHAVDIAEHNIMALVHELRTGERYSLPKDTEAPHAKLARGPTTIEDLAEASQGKEDSPLPLPTVTEVDEDDEEEEGKEDKKEGEKEEAIGGESNPADLALESSTAALDLGAGPQAAESAPTAAESAPVDAESAPAAAESAPVDAESEPSSSASPPFIAAASFEGVRLGYAFQNGAQGVGYYLDSQQKTQADADPSPVSEAVAEGASSKATPGGGSGCGTSSSGASKAAEEVSEDKKKQMAAEAEALRAAEAALDSDARQYIRKRFRIVLATGSDIKKAVSGRSKLLGAFSVLSVGHRHMHLLKPEYQLDKVSTPGCVLIAESAKYMVQLKAEAAAEFDRKIVELAGSAGWLPGGDGESMTAPDAYRLFTHP